MELIFHEKQEGSLCAQHCLNNLLQGSYFTAPDLANIGRELDEEERARMAEGGVHSEAYNKFLQQPSTNVDDSGYFSIQVITKALEMFSLEPIAYSSQNELAVTARRDPTQMNAYICNYRDHWLTIRKIGPQWFNLNSMHSGAKLVSDTFLALYLAQLQKEGYSIFIVNGSLPECAAENVLNIHPVLPDTTPSIASQAVKVEESTLIELDDDEDKALKETLNRSVAEIEDDNLQAAISRSLTDYHNLASASEQPSCSSSSTSEISKEIKESSKEIPQEISPDSPEMTEEEKLELAIRMSMDS